MTTKLIRTKQEWTEPCRECGGSGHVRKKSYFHLWTADEYATKMGMDRRLESIVGADGAYPCIVLGWATIFEACREGVEIAGTLREPVAFDFNGHTVIYRNGDDPEAVAKEWWVRAYGKSYEDSMRDR